MAELARKWLCIPVSSTASERTFSNSGLIVTKLRTRLEPDRVEQMLYIRQNYDKVKSKLGKINLISEDPDDQPQPASVVDEDDLFPPAGGSQPGGSQHGGSHHGSQPPSQPASTSGSGSQSSEHGTPRSQLSRAPSVGTPAGTISLADLTDGERGKQLRREIAAGFKSKQATLSDFLKKRDEAAAKKQQYSDEEEEIQEIPISDNVVMGMARDPAIIATFRTVGGKFTKL